MQQLDEGERDEEREGENELKVAGRCVTFNSTPSLLFTLTPFLILDPLTCNVHLENDTFTKCEGLLAGQTPSKVSSSSGATD